MPDQNLYKYRIWCVTEGKWVYSDYILADKGAPTTCPNNTAHTIDPALTAIISTVPPDGTYDADGNLSTVQEPRGGTEKYFYVPNLCDPCCWYQKSTPISNEVLSTSDNQTYSSSQASWIDLTHGRVFKEAEIPSVTQYLPVVEVDIGAGFVLQAENSWGVSDNDYIVDYDAGTVTFNVALQPTDIVRASFYYGEDSVFTIEAEAGKRLKVLYTEVQITKDVVMNANINFEVWVYNPADLPNRVPYKVETYKRLIDFFQESTGPFPVIPAFGGAGERGLGSDLITIPFNYQAYRDLKSSQGTQLRVNVDGNVPMSGEFANATFYCLSEDE